MFIRDSGTQVTLTPCLQEVHGRMPAGQGKDPDPLFWIHHSSLEVGRMGRFGPGWVKAAQNTVYELIIERRVRVYPMHARVVLHGKDFYF